LQLSPSCCTTSFVPWYMYLKDCNLFRLWVLVASKVERLISVLLSKSRLIQLGSVSKVLIISFCAKLDDVPVVSYASVEGSNTDLSMFRHRLLYFPLSYEEATFSISSVSLKHQIILIISLISVRVRYSETLDGKAVRSV
jgi:hypothetical protein